MYVQWSLPSRLLARSLAVNSTLPYSISTSRRKGLFVFLFPVNCMISGLGATLYSVFLFKTRKNAKSNEGGRKKNHFK